MSELREKLDPPSTIPAWWNVRRRVSWLTSAVKDLFNARPEAFAYADKVGKSITNYVENEMGGLAKKVATAEEERFKAANLLTRTVLAQVQHQLQAKEQRRNAERAEAVLEGLLKHLKLKAMIDEAGAATIVPDVAVKPRRVTLKRKRVA